MVVVQLMGGLGNQMFQYALGRSLSLKAGSVLKLDTDVLLDHRPGIHAVNRNFDLDIFDLPAVTSSVLDTWKYNTHALSLPFKIAGRLYQLITANNGIVREAHFHFDKSVLLKKNEIYLMGLWQSYRYFSGIEDQLKKDFCFKHRLEASAALLASEIENTNSVCLNVRRGDFVSVKSTNDILGFVGIEYYEKAVRYFKERHEHLHFYVFSDEIEWCKSHLKFIDDPVTFVDHSYAGTKFSNYMELMSKCKYFIIPNSTFAWWAAWLSNSGGKEVVAPLKWMKDESINTQDLLPETWVKL